MSVVSFKEVDTKSYSLHIKFLVLDGLGLQRYQDSQALKLAAPGALLSDKKALGDVGAIQRPKVQTTQFAIGSLKQNRLQPTKHVQAVVRSCPTSSDRLFTSQPISATTSPRKPGECWFHHLHVSW